MGDPPADALADALALLARRDYTRVKLADKLRDKGHAEAAVEAACRRCAEYGYLDDHAYGLSRAQRRLERRPMGRRALVQDLRRQGLDSTMSEQVADEVYAEEDGEEAVLDEALRQWIDRHGEPEDWRSARRCADHLARRGFPAGAVHAALSPWLDAIGE